MGALNSYPVDVIRNRGSIRDQDVLKLRGAYYSDGVIGPAEAATLFALNNACPVQDPAWSDFFIEAVTDYIVNLESPEGYVTSANAQWLLMKVSRDGRIRSKTELDLVVNVLFKARWSPASLVGFALKQVRAAVLLGDGPMRALHPAPKGTITEVEVELIRRVLYAFGGDGNVAITRAEAEILFEINELVADAAPCPAWIELFVKVLANVVMTASGYSVPTREEALRREAGIEMRSDAEQAAMLRALVALSLSTVLGAYREQSAQDRALSRLERQRIEIITNEEVTEGDASWLASRLTRAEPLTAVETAVLAYLKRHDCHVHPLLQLTVDSVVRAA